MKYLIFDSGPIISLAMSGLLGVLERLKSVFDGDFILTPDVFREVVERPMKIKEYKLEAIKVKNLIDKGVFKMSDEIIAFNHLDKETKRILKTANGALRTYHSGKKIELIQDGEASCLAFSRLCKCESLIVVDERTTRLLSEAPKRLQKLMEKKLHTKIILEKSLIDSFRNFKFIRSSELLYLAYKKDLFEIKKDKQFLDALLYGVKFKGTSISSEEIEEMKRMI